MSKKSKFTHFSKCPYTTQWCFGRAVGNTAKCKLCDVEMKFMRDNNMKMINGVEIDKEIREGWTIKDFMDEIDDLVYDAFMGLSIHRVPKTTYDLSVLIEDLIPKHIFTNQKQIDRVVDDLTKIYAMKFSLED